MRDGQFSSSEREQEIYGFQEFLEQGEGNKGRDTSLSGFPVAYERYNRLMKC